MSPVEAIVERTLAGMGYELVDLEFAASGLLRVFIDSAGGIRMEDCERVSHQLSRVFEVEAVEYRRLEVSSPGLDRPLFTLQQFERFRGQQARVSLYAPLDGRRKFKGTILGATEGVVKLDQDGTEVELDMGNIAKARLVPDYDSLFLKREETR